jgi:nucleoside-diphosphate-sugar epimerase
VKKILVTGATGFIGQRTVPYLLERNYRVHAVHPAPPPAIADENIIWHRADLLSNEDTTALLQEVRPSHLLHLAWYVKPGSFWNATENLHWLRSSLFLAEQFAIHGGQRIVTAGTCAEYDWNWSSPFVEVSTQMRPQTLYGAAKYALYVTLERFAANVNLSFASGRVFFPFGPNEPSERVIPSVIRSLLKNERAATTHGAQIRDFMYVDHVAEAFATLLDSDVNGAVNIGSGNGVSLKEVVESVGRIMARSELLDIGALPARSNEPPEIVADVTRLREEVKFDTDQDLTGPLHSTIEWWRENL